MNIPDLNRLRVFFWVYECKSVVAAAKELHITQSAVSQHLKKLELELGTPNFKIPSSTIKNIIEGVIRSKVIS